MRCKGKVTRKPLIEGRVGGIENQEILMTPITFPPLIYAPWSRQEGMRLS